MQAHAQYRIKCFVYSAGVAAALVHYCKVGDKLKYYVLEVR